jgi:hypothetical protein
MGTVISMELPAGLAALARDLEAVGFQVEMEEWHAWPRGGEVELSAPSGHPVRRIRMVEDREVWDVEVKLGRGWYDLFTALSALQERPNQRRALTHEEQRPATLEFLRRFTGDSSEVKAIKRRQKELSIAVTRWAQGKGELPS